MRQEGKDGAGDRIVRRKHLPPGPGGGSLDAGALHRVAENFLLKWCPERGAAGAPSGAAASCSGPGMQTPEADPLCPLLQGLTSQVHGGWMAPLP